MRDNEKKVFEVRFAEDVQGMDIWFVVAFTIKQVKHWMKKRVKSKAGTKHELPEYDLCETDRNFYDVNALADLTR